jgi:thiamine pyrophosphate-dependent acetolactate synthase large subunit-like protein
MEDKKRMQVNFRLDKNLLSDIQAKCKADNITQTDFIIQALKKALHKDVSIQDDCQQVLSSFSLRLNHMESCLAASLATQKSLLERLALLENQEEVAWTADSHAVQERLLRELRFDQQDSNYTEVTQALSNLIMQLKKASSNY